MPQTINTALSRLRSSETRSTARRARSASNFSFRVAPDAEHWISTCSYRIYDYDNRTPDFAMTQAMSPTTTRRRTCQVRRDTEPFGVGAPYVRRRLQVAARGAAHRRASASPAFSEERTSSHLRVDHRQHVRLIFDTVGNRWLTLRTKYEHAQRRGAGIDAGRARTGGDRRAARHAPLRPRAARPQSRHHARPRSRPHQHYRSPDRWPWEKTTIGSKCPAPARRWRAFSACATTRTACIRWGSTQCLTDRVTLGASYSLRALQRAVTLAPGQSRDRNSSIPRETGPPKAPTKCTR